MKKILMIIFPLFLVCGENKKEGTKDDVEINKGDIYPDVECFSHKDCSWGKGCKNGFCIEPSNKGLGIAPLFSLVDLNPKSQSHGKTIKLEAEKGKLIFLYFASTSCAYCHSQVKYFRNIMLTLEKLGYNDIAFFVINMVGAEDSVQDMITVLPILQDTFEEDVFGKYGAQKDNVFIIDKAGFIRAKYDDPKMPEEKTPLTEKCIEIYKMDL